MLALLFARAEGRNFNMPGGDGTIVALAGGWAAVLIFYRVLRPARAGNGYPVGVQWGFFLAFVARRQPRLRGLAHARRPNARQPPVRRRRRAGRAAGPSASRRPPGRPGPEGEAETDQTPLVPVGGPPRADAPGSPAASPRARPRGPVAGRRPRRRAAAARRRRPRYPPAPGEPEQLSFEDAPPGEEH